MPVSFSFFWYAPHHLRENLENYIIQNITILLISIIIIIDRNVGIHRSTAMKKSRPLIQGQLRF